MTTETLQLLEEMNSKLSNLSGLTEDDLFSIQQAILITSEAIAQLKALLTNSKFESVAAEIRFFKKLKPQFDGRLIFYLMQLRMHTRSASDRTAIYAKELDRAELFYQKHYSFWQYFKMGLSDLDEYYFTRKDTDEPIFLDEHQIHYDSQANAPMSGIVARFYAYDLLKEHSAKLTEAHFSGSSNKQDKSLSLSWTSAKSELIELIYALHEYRAFNNGQPDIKKIAEYFSAIFNIRFSNIYKTYEDIRLRKKNNTPFLDALKAGLERRIDRDNENAM